MDTLRREIKQSKPFANLREETLLNIWRTADAVSQDLQRLLKSHGVSQTQYNVLRILRGAGKAGIASGEIGSRLIARDPDITRLMDRLERAGLAQRGRLKEDRRVILARITPKGLKLLADLDHPVMQLIDQTLGHMNASRLKTLIGLLEEARGGES
ncbi:MAG: MarR family transcriptional regulator [Acidobacteriia bacterium]|nr:MarR family transcriptional regulator [Terriglobia bacterium]